MALLRMKELRVFPSEELSEKLSSLENELMHERGVAAMGGAPPNPGRIKALRINIARIKTLLREMEMRSEIRGGMKEEKS